MGGCKVKSIHSKIHVLKVEYNSVKDDTVLLQICSIYRVSKDLLSRFCTTKKSGRLAFEKKGLQDKSCKRAQVAVEETLLLLRFLVSRNVHSFSETLVKTC